LDFDIILIVSFGIPLGNMMASLEDDRVPSDPSHISFLVLLLELTCFAEERCSHFGVSLNIFQLHFVALHRPGGGANKGKGGN